VSASLVKPSALRTTTHTVHTQWHSDTPYIHYQYNRVLRSVVHGVCVASFSRCFAPRTARAGPSPHSACALLCPDCCNGREINTRTFIKRQTYLGLRDCPRWGWGHEAHTRWQDHAWTMPARHAARHTRAWCALRERILIQSKVCSVVILKQSADLGGHAAFTVAWSAARRIIGVNLLPVHGGRASERVPQYSG
jgi:hypothetical protein